MGDSSYLYVDLVGALAVGEVGQPGAEANAGISRELMKHIQITNKKMHQHTPIRLTVRLTFPPVMFPTLSPNLSLPSSSGTVKFSPTKL